VPGVGVGGPGRTRGMKEEPRKRKGTNVVASKHASPNDGKRDTRAAAALSIKVGNNPLVKVIRWLGVWSWILLSYPIHFCGMPLRCLNPVLRSRGVPNGSMPSDLLQIYWAMAVVWLSGIEVKVEGAENLTKLRSHSSIIMANHASGLDPFIIMAYSSVAPKYVFKKSLLFLVAPIFLLAWGYGHIPIDRSNRDAAISSLKDAAKKINKFDRTIVIFPEGTRSTDGKLQPFKRGPFHLAEEARVPIAPLYVEGAWELFRPNTFSFQPDSGAVRVRVLPTIAHTADDTVDTLEQKVRSALEKAQSESRPITGTSSGFTSLIACIVLIGLATLELCFLYGLFF